MVTECSGKYIYIYNLPLPPPSPVPNKPYGFCGRKAPRRKEDSVAQHWAGAGVALKPCAAALASL